MISATECPCDDSDMLTKALTNTLKKATVSQACNLGSEANGVSISSETRACTVERQRLRVLFVSRRTENTAKIVRGRPTARSYSSTPVGLPGILDTTGRQLQSKLRPMRPAGWLMGVPNGLFRCRHWRLRAVEGGFGYGRMRREREQMASPSRAHAGWDGC